MNPTFSLVLVLFSLLLLNCKNSTASHQEESLDENIQCTEKRCIGTYMGAEFIDGDDIAHQFSNKMSKVVGEKLKEFYKNKTYKKVDLNAIQMSTEGMGTGQVVYRLSVPFVSVDSACAAYTSFDHVGGWNHAPALEQRKKELLKVVMSGHQLLISQLKTTPEGLQEYWIQWKNKQVQANCQ